MARTARKSAVGDLQTASQPKAAAKGTSSRGQAKPRREKSADVEVASKPARRTVAKDTTEAPAQQSARKAPAAAPRSKGLAPERSSKAGATKTAAPRASKANVRRPADPAVDEVANEKIKLGHLSEFLGFHLRLAQDASYRVFSRQGEKDLVKPGRYPALAIIQLNPGISQSALGRAIARDKSTVSPLIKDLQNNGFINRKPSAHDRRSVTLALTKKGERILARLHDRAVEHESELDRLIGPSKSRFKSMLEKIIEGMAADIGKQA